MKPRWQEHWLPEERATYLGGTNTLDLWIDYEGDLRLSLGEGSFNWDYFRLHKDGCIERISTDTKMTDDDIKEAFAYMNLFVPDWKDRMKQMRDRNEAQMG